MTIVEYERLVVLADSGIDCDGEIKAWLRTHLQSCPNDEADVHDLLSAARGQRFQKFTLFIRDRFGFEVTSEHGAVVVTAVLVELCELVLRGELPVAKLGHVVRHLDTKFTSGPDPTPYPVGLGKLYGALDWCSEGWNLRNQPDLRETLEQFGREHS